MAVKIPRLQPKSLSIGYFESLPSFAWSDVKDKDKIGREALDERQLRT